MGNDLALPVTGKRKRSGEEMKSGNSVNLLEKETKKPDNMTRLFRKISKDEKFRCIFLSIE